MVRSSRPEMIAPPSASLIVQTLNHELFLIMNAPVHPSAFVPIAAMFFATYLIWLIPTIVLIGWLRGGVRVRKLMLQATAAALVGLTINHVVGLLWPQPRPFMIGIGHTLISHAADPSFPSDHLTLQWAVAFSFILNRRMRTLGVALALLGLPLAWGRIYVGVHFPVDVVGSILVAGFSAWLCSRYADWIVDPGFRWINTAYRRLLAPLIRHG